MAPEIRAEAHAVLERVERFFRRQLRPAPGYAAFYAYQLALIEEFRRSTEMLPKERAVRMPPGSPIGG